MMNISRQFYLGSWPAKCSNSEKVLNIMAGTNESLLVGSCFVTWDLAKFHEIAAIAVLLFSCHGHSHAIVPLSNINDLLYNTTIHSKLLPNISVLWNTSTSLLKSILLHDIFNLPIYNASAISSTIWLFSNTNATCDAYTLPKLSKQSKQTSECRSI